ncbi:hypothetical protein [Paracoccus onubensis]|uniref:Uncharacterized protein n=1 Tax=Paracoccus onubensis TaxID=1675788 RepID=A0A418SUL0_9RHOB|nr:hypothetical protein [Paracoccus onubensis]RJE84589.1 hypothetical protein D3P04_13150 [Paracoccus onubensis]
MTPTKAFQIAIAVYDTYADRLQTFAYRIERGEIQGTKAIQCLATPTVSGADIHALSVAVRRIARQAETQLAKPDVGLALIALVSGVRTLARRGYDILTEDCPDIQEPGSALQPAMDAMDTAFPRPPEGAVTTPDIEAYQRQLEQTNPWRP